MTKTKFRTGIMRTFKKRNGAERVSNFMRILEHIKSALN